MRGVVSYDGFLPAQLFSLVASGQIKLRRIDGWRKIAAVLSQRRSHQVIE